jgi:hypothetical protein
VTEEERSPNVPLNPNALMELDEDPRDGKCTTLVPRPLMFPGRYGRRLRCTLPAGHDGPHATVL